MIKELRDQGRELILATHEMAFAQKAADQIAFVAEGRILESGKPSELFTSPKTPHLRTFLSRKIEA
jgi:polar amino acid transport system ATP-binding protein